MLGQIWTLLFDTDGIPDFFFANLNFEKKKIAVDKNVCKLTLYAKS